jgi:toxin ParE1/3/4
VKAKLTRAADLDLQEIAEYTRAKWGDAQAAAYHFLLERACLHIIPENVALARKVESRPKLWRWRCEHHIVYFRREADAIVIVRVLHERMLPLRHL